MIARAHLIDIDQEIAGRRNIGGFVKVEGHLVAVCITISCGADQILVGFIFEARFDILPIEREAR